ncbi:efflux RND transporter periplasmic adaptor subunit [Pareuzebyella sediminis]|uniref:efflux RND transporter periplasmic adaptor subunit n=1 Tax=Pareuzebyella sediminis TaxID=2607998 RepID=UPI0011EE5DC3|nr:HlyD family efflux transporter periplasmic adaptor subunit [Pareuzebyella sediminis]
MDKRKVILSILGLLLILASVFAAKAIIDSKQSFRPPQEKIVKTVFVDTVKNGKVPITVNANGNLVAKQRMELFSEVQGVFRKGPKLFKTGQRYSAGETIINIDASEYRASVQSAKSNLFNQITSIMPDLRLDYPEVFDKWQSYLSNFDMANVTPPLPEMETEKEKFFISGRGILTSYYNVKNLEQRLAKYRIVAPYTGVLTEALVTEGTLVRSGQQLGEFINVGIYELEVSIPKTYDALLKVGEPVTLTNLGSTKTYTGVVSRVNGKVDQSSQTVKTYIEVADSDLKEGMYLEAKLNAKEEVEAIEINRSLLLDNNQIFVVRDSVLDVIDVKPVYFSDKKVVLKEVPDGMTIISKPVVGAYVGMLVKVFGEEKTITQVE